MSRGRAQCDGKLIRSNFVATLSRALSKFPSQQRHHFACEQVQESRLIGTWRVKHQMIEAELHVRPDSVDDFLRVAAHDPARYRTLHRQSIRQAFHLERILDIDFLIWLQRQCSPESRVVARTIEVGVERYLHFNQPVDRVERLAGLLQALIDIRQQGIAVQFRLLAAGTYEALRILAREFRHERTGSRHVDGYGFFRAVVNRRIFGLVELPLKCQPLTAPELLDKIEGFLKTRGALLLIWPSKAAARHLVQGFSRADT